MIQFSMAVKKGTENIVMIEGRQLQSANFSVDDLHTVFQLERQLERLFGLRFHINCKNDDNKEGGFTLSEVKP